MWLKKKVNFICYESQIKKDDIKKHRKIRIRYRYR